MNILKLTFLKLSTLILSSLLVFKTAAQDSTFFAQAKDGTAFEVRSVNSNPDIGRYKSIALGPIGISGIKILGYYHYEPTKFYASAMLGYNNYMVDGNLFLLNRTKNTTIRQSLNNNSNVKYVLKFPSQKRVSLGPHLSFNYINDFYGATWHDEHFKVLEIAGGISILKSESAHWDVLSLGLQKQGSSYRRINIDGIINAFGEIDTAEYSPGTTASNYLMPFGYRVYIDGKTAVWGKKGSFAIHYKIGMQSRVSTIAPIPIAGLAIGYAFE